MLEQLDYAFFLFLPHALVKLLFDRNLKRIVYKLNTKAMAMLET